MSELGGAIVSITLVMMSVFVPVSFMGGNGRYFLPSVRFDHGDCHRFLGSERPDLESCAVCHLPETS